MAPAGAAQKMYGAQKYDKAREERIAGTIAGVEEHHGPGGACGIHLMVRMETGSIEVHVAPKEYLEQEGVTFKTGESINVTGARASFEGQEVIVARLIRVDGRLFSVRDSEGRPLWRDGA
jgi:DNA/RNA endonuclease YhcR with UshA esterase domain